MLKRMKLAIKIFLTLFNFFEYKNININTLILQIQLVGNKSLGIVLLTAFFVGMVFSFQIIKELLYLNASNFIGSILTISFIRELSPILTSIIVVGRIGSYFTSELASMKITEQIDALHILGVNPIIYLVLPRLYACLIMLPILNILSFATSLSSSAYLCFILYSINSQIFFSSALASLFYLDVIKSCLKSCIFAIIISIISCAWGLSAISSSQGVGLATTSSVVFSLISILSLDFILSYFMFNSVQGTFQLL
uniref:ABC transporter permease n=1 Tax=Ceramothamnion japonicum TaxID=218448 RepID=A0A1C9CDD9_CERJP|nr:hypothetical protein Ceram_101 [Ceramium japonicum]AOM66377.1 hypothetical protein Ceram_101 [Ceramium japonicum]